MWDTNNTTFLENLRAVLTRFREYNITVNPTKVRLGLPEIEYVGRIVNGQGLSMSAAKREQIFQYRLPECQKGLKQFLGIANYARDHIKDHSIIAYPLNQLVLNYAPNKRLVWTTESTEAFEKLKQLINDSPTMCFLDDAHRCL